MERKALSNTQRGGKRLSGTTTGGTAWLTAVLAEVAWADARRKAGYRNGGTNCAGQGGE